MKPRIAIFHPILKAGGGSQAIPLWLAAGIKDFGPVTLISMGEIDLSELNRFYGTGLEAGEIERLSLPVPRWLRHNFDAFKAYRLHRFSKENASKFDVLISTYNVMDFGRRGIQFIADFCFDDNVRRRFDAVAAGARGALYKKSPFRSAYLGFSDIMARRTKKGWMQNLTVANSVWSQNILSRYYGLESTVIYPPVTGVFPESPWEKRENGFLVVGRLQPEKRLERVVAILSRVRSEGFDVHLHIIGRIDDSPYVRTISRLCQQNRNWAYMEGMKGGREKNEFLTRHRFGLSGRQNEPFGIAVGEMVKAGCLVWVPDGGGQTEIVEHPQLTFRDDDEAVDKIMTVLKSNSLQDTLRAHLAGQAGKFSQERFMTEARSLFVRFLEG